MASECNAEGIHATMWIDTDGELHCLACEPPEIGEPVVQVVQWMDPDHCVDLRTGRPVEW